VRYSSGSNTELALIV
jgi:hypothetical protein